MAPYLTATQINTRLYDRFGITATVTDADAEIASAELDSLAPFKGEKADPDQERQFPRGDDAAVPEPILDAVALLAYQAVEDEGPAIQSESVLDQSITYASPKVTQTSRRVLALVAPYLLRTGSRL